MDIAKTGPNLWRTGDSPIFNYVVTLTNNSATAAPTGSLNWIDLLPVDAAGFAQMDAALTCPIAVTVNPVPSGSV